MKSDLTKPCKECPFRKRSPPGWLGPWEAEELLMVAGRHDLACHMTVHRGEDHTPMPHHQACAGAALHMNNKLQVAFHPSLVELQDKLKDSPEAKNVFKDTTEYLMHHAPEILRGKMRQPRRAK
jgi:hypothetical protein